MEIQSLAGKKCSAFFDSRSLSRACAAPQLPLSLLTAWPQEEPAGICDFLFQLSSSSNSGEGLGCLLPPQGVGRDRAAGGMSGLAAGRGDDVPACREGWCTSHFMENSHPKACPPTTPLKKVKLRVESSLAHHPWLLHLSLHAVAPEAGSSRELWFHLSARSKIVISSLRPVPGGSFEGRSSSSIPKTLQPMSTGPVPGAGRRCACVAGAALLPLPALPSPACPCLAGSLLPGRSLPRSQHHRHSRVDGDGCVSCRDSPSSSPFSFHSNSWRKKQPNHQSLKNPSLPLLLSPNIAAWCRSSTTRTG